MRIGMRVAPGVYVGKSVSTRGAGNLFAYLIAGLIVVGVVAFILSHWVAIVILALAAATFCFGTAFRTMRRQRRARP